MNVPGPPTRWAWCPECGQVAELAAVWWHPGSPDGIRMAEVRCVTRHPPFRMPLAEVDLM